MNQQSWQKYLGNYQGERKSEEVDFILHMIDSSPAMLEVLRYKIGIGENNVVIHEGELSNLAEQTIMRGSVDWVFSNMALHHVEDIPSLLKDLKVLIKPGGRLTIGDLLTESGTFHAPETVPYNGFDSNELA